MSPELLLALLLALLLLLGGAAVLAAVRRSGRDAISRRVQLITPAPEGDGARPVAGPGAPSAALVRAPSRGMSQAQLREIGRVCRALRLPSRHAPAVFAVLRMILTLVLTVAGFAVARLFLGRAPLAAQLLVEAAFGVIGWLVPGMILGHAVKRHVEEVASGLPEALELLVVCVEAGLSLEDAIDRITGELDWAQPALAEELALTAADMKILPDPRQALNNLAARIDTQSVRLVVTAMTQTLRYGTPLAQTLRATSAELRNDAMMRMEEKGNRLPTLLTVPLILFIMPTIFLIIGGPAVLQLIDTFRN